MVAGMEIAFVLYDGFTALDLVGPYEAFRDVLTSMGVDVSTDRVVIDEPFVSGAGVSAGIDMALALTARVHGEDLARRIQLMIEYDPQPPFDAGSPEKAGPDLVAATLAGFAALAALENGDKVVATGREWRALSPSTDFAATSR